jgi:hypothetical protein
VLEIPIISQRTAGLFALASGLVAIAATAFLMAFYALEAPRLLKAGNLDQPTLLGHTNDLLIAVMLVLMLPVVGFVARAGGWPSPLARVIAFGGAAGLLLGALVQVLYVLGIVTGTLQPLLIGVAFLLVGGWLVALSLAPSASRLSGRAASVAGVVAGLGHIGIGAVSILIGPSALADPNAFAGSPMLPALLGVVVLLAYVGLPVWGILLGRRWITAIPH